MVTTSIVPLKTRSDRAVAIDDCGADMYVEVWLDDAAVRLHLGRTQQKSGQQGGPSPLCDRL